jgi:phage shock protein A
VNDQYKAVAAALNVDDAPGTLDSMMGQAREAMARTSNKIEDLAREITEDRAKLAEKIARFNSICGEIIETPERIQGQTQ